MAVTEAAVREAIARAEAATRGEWRADDRGVWHERVYDYHTVEGICWKPESRVYRGGIMWPQNSVFIAAARTDVPAFGKEILRLREVLWGVRDLIEEPSAERVDERTRIVRMIEDACFGGVAWR